MDHVFAYHVSEHEALNWCEGMVGGGPVEFMVEFCKSFVGAESAVIWRCDSRDSFTTW